MPRHAGQSKGGWVLGPATMAAIARGEEVAPVGTSIPAAYLPAKELVIPKKPTKAEKKNAKKRERNKRLVHFRVGKRSRDIVVRAKLVFSWKFH